MRLRFLIIALPLCANPAFAQTVRDAGRIAGDIAQEPQRAAGTAKEIAQEINAPVVAPAAANVSLSDGLMIGAVIVEGAPSVPREAFAPSIADFLGKQASIQDLQALAQAVASVARKRGFVFATASVPPQTVDAGMVTVRIDEGDIAQVRVVGSRSERLQRTLDPIVGQGVRRSTLERQLLLAGDLPGIEVVSTKLVREDVGNVLVVQVRETRGEGAVGVDTYGSRDLGPLRARLRYEFAGLASDGDVLAVQAITTPANPGQLAFLSARYAMNVGTGGTQIAVSGAVGRAAPSNSGSKSKSTFVSVSVSTPLVRTNRASVWMNGEIGLQRVMGNVNGIADLRDSTVTATAWLYGTTRITNGRLSGGLGVVRGLPVWGATELGDPFASRRDGSAEFTKGFFWADWVQPLGSGFSVKIAANGQLADRPLLATQEIGIGGSSFGRAFDFWERFGDNGIMASGELRWRSKPVDWIDWVEPFAVFDGGRVWNLRNGFGGGELNSTGGGIRAAFGKLQFSVEAAVPLNTARIATGNRTPRVNVSIERRF